MGENEIDAVGFASAGAIIVISLTAAALLSVSALVVAGSIVVTSMLTAGVVWLWMRRKRKRLRHVEPSADVQEFMRRNEAFRARMREFAKPAVREP